MTPWKNKLYYGDNLRIMREYLDDESVDLIYLDPPFNSKATYNVLFREKNGSDSSAQITAFDDTWHWDAAAAETYHDLVTRGPQKLAALMDAFHSFLGQNDMIAYLAMMAARLVEMRRVLKPTGSIYLHCDPTASHYLKIVLDSIFGGENYKNEIIWQRINAKGNVQRKFGAVHDVILLYAKILGKEQWNQVYRPLDQSYIDKTYRFIEEGTGRKYSLDNLTASMQRASTGQIYEWKGKRPPATRCWVYAVDRMEELDRQGRIIYSKNGYPRFKRYLDENLGEKIPDIWSDIFVASGNEALGYPTQKPEALLERIIKASSNEGDVVLDPFCGCGTTVTAAEKLNRRWIGIDITHLAITLIKHRLEDSFRQELSPYEIIGDPKDLASARALAEADKFQFEWWALSLVDARPAQDKKKGADRGVDGYMYFFDDESGKAKKIVVQVKGGHVSAAQVRDLKGTLEREKAVIGVFITLSEPSAPMRAEAADAGFYEIIHPISGQGMKFPRIQIYTIEELLNGALVKIPAHALEATIKKAGRVQKQGNESEQTKLL